MKGISYNFTAELWQHPGSSGWYFISLPAELAKEIRDIFKKEEEGWGRLKVIAKIAGTEWRTSIWFDTKRNTYLLPVKTPVRKAENMKAGTYTQVIICI